MSRPVAGRAGSLLHLVRILGCYVFVLRPVLGHVVEFPGDLPDSIWNHDKLNLKGTNYMKQKRVSFIMITLKHIIAPLLGLASLSSALSASAEPVSTTAGDLLRA